MTFKLGAVLHSPHIYNSIILIPSDSAPICLLWSIDKSRVHSSCVDKMPTFSTCRITHTCHVKVLILKSRRCTLAIRLHVVTKREDAPTFQYYAGFGCYCVDSSWPAVDTCHKTASRTASRRCGEIQSQRSSWFDRPDQWGRPKGTLLQHFG